MDLSAVNPRGKRVTELMKGFDHREKQPQKNEVLWKEDAIENSLSEIRPMLTEQHQSGHDDGKPENRAHPAKCRLGYRQEKPQEAVRIKKRKLPGEKTEDAA